MNGPDWREWKHTPDVTVWQACALSLDINPYIMLIAVDQRLMSAYPEKGPFFVSNVFPSRDVEKEYLLRVRLLSANLPNYVLFPTRYRDRWNRSLREGNSLVRLSEFASWAVSVVEWEGLPPQLVELATAVPRDSITAAQTDTAPSGATEKTAPEVALDDDDHAALAKLFDPVKAATLEAMFPDGGKWAGYAERAARNGLSPARDGRSLFNPYHAAVWWLTQGPNKWDLAKCLRVLANNLPPRSRDSKHLLTGEFD